MYSLFSSFKLFEQIRQFESSLYQKTELSLEIVLNKEKYEFANLPVSNTYFMLLSAKNLWGQIGKNIRFYRSPPDEQALPFREKLEIPLK